MMRRFVQCVLKAWEPMRKYLPKELMLGQFEQIVPENELNDGEVRRIGSVIPMTPIDLA